MYILALHFHSNNTLNTFFAINFYFLNEFSDYVYQASCLITYSVHCFLRMRRSRII